MGNKVLFIEDESDQVFLMKKRFESAGYEFFHALGGKEGIKQAQEVHPDIILLDLNLPELSGFEVLKILKADPNLKPIPVCVVTARADKHLKDICKKSGAAETVLKPYDSHELLDLVKSLLT